MRTFFYEEANAREFIATMQQNAPEIRNPAVFAIEGALEHKRKTPLASEWLVLEWKDGVPDLKADVHYDALAEGMHHIRRSLHKHHICPHVRLGGPTQIVALSVAQGKKTEGRATIHALPYKHRECQTCCETMGKYLGREFKYYSESQEVVSHRAMRELMKPPKRPNVKTADETSILRAQNYECAICGDWLTRDPAHADHAIARFL